MRGTKTHDLAAGDFEAPLLQVLATLASNQPGVEVNYEKTYDPVCQLLGITRDQYGVHTDGINTVERWVQFAFRSLCDQGLGQRQGRGRWALTADGVKRVTNQPAVTPLAATSVVTATTLPAPSTGISIMVGPKQTGDTYHPDSYIRWVAAQACGCFAKYTDTAQTCNGCGLRPSCLNGVAATLSGLQATLAAEDQAAVEAARKAAQPQPPAPMPAPAPVAKVPAPATSGKYSGEPRFIRQAIDAQCAHCKQALKAGSDAVWLKNVNGTTDSVLLHKECYDRNKA